MFHYPQYRHTDPQAIRQLVDRFPLALVTTWVDGQWHSSHVPLFLNEDNTELFGHVDAGNGQFQCADGQSVQVVFAGPNAYIPPEAYATRQLPTWNYLSAHITGTLTLVHDTQQKIAILSETACRLNGQPGAFRIDHADERIHRWIGSIRGLKIRVLSQEGRFKLSQDKSPGDTRAAAEHFSRVVAQQVTPDLLMSFSRTGSTSTPTPTP